MREFSDFELLSILESNGKKPTMKNLRLLKEAIESAKEKEDSGADEPEKNEVTSEDLGELFDSKEEPIPSEETSKKIINPLDKNSLTAQKVEGIRTSRQTAERAAIIKEFLVNECKVSSEILNNLSEAAEQVTISTVISNLFNTLQNKLSTIDTSSADRSKGDISSLRELDSIQEAITQIEAMIERSNRFLPEGNEMISTIIKSLVYLNQYSNVFKDAYRNKKTLLILKYESLILSIISSVSYLISALIDFKSGSPEIRDVIQLEKIAPIRTLENFVASVNNGEFKTVTRDIGVLREYYTEFSVETLGKLFEATDTINMVIDGIKNFVSSIEDNNRVSNLLYKLTGTVILLFSLRDTFYSLFRMKTKVADMLQGIESFANMNFGGQIGKLTQFANKFKLDAENASTMSQREIEDDNRKINLNVRAIQSAPVVPALPEKTAETNNAPASQAASTTAGFSWDF